MANVGAREDEWLGGWDDTPGIVSVSAELDGRVALWRRVPGSGLVCEQDRFRPWLVLASLEDLAHLGPRLGREQSGVEAGADARERSDHMPRLAVTYEELRGPGALRYLVRADDGRMLHAALLKGAARRLGRPLEHVRQLGAARVLCVAPEEQYLIASGRTYFRGLAYDDLARLAFDLETTGLDPERDRIFLIALADARGRSELLEAAGDDDAAEAELIRRFAARVRAIDPDVIENHNLHGFDLPFLARRAQRLGVPLVLGRTTRAGFGRRPAARGVSLGVQARAGAHEPDGGAQGSWRARRFRFTLPGRELIDTADAVLRYDFAARDLPSHGLKAVARHFGIASPNRELIAGEHVHEVFRADPARVRRYALEDAREASALARLLGGAAFALAAMVPRRYERLADAGPATGVLDPLLLRAYLRERAALPVHEQGDGTPHSGAALYLFATGVAERVVKADVASLYPSLMRQYRIGPARDRLGVLLALVDRLVEQRLAAKARARAATPGSSERYAQEALSGAMKLVVNSAYGYLGAAGLTRFSDVHAANEVTRHGRELLALICRELARRGVCLLEADTDGVYFAVPPSFREEDERRVIREVAALLPAQVHLEFDGRYAAMLSHEPKNYALAPYALDARSSSERSKIVLRGVAFRSRRAEPFGEQFLQRALACLLAGDVAGVRDAYAATVLALRRRELETRAVAACVRLTKTPAQYLATREQRRELAYEALFGAGRSHWTVGERAYVYRALAGRAALWSSSGSRALGRASTSFDGGAEVALADGDEIAAQGDDPRDYDVEFYVRSLRETFAARLARALTADDYAAVVADPGQLSLLERPLSNARPILTTLSTSGLG